MFVVGLYHYDKMSIVIIYSTKHTDDAVSLLGASLFPKIF